MAVCGATATAHCCWVAGKVCEHFRPELVGVNRGCALRAELGDWDAVYLDVRYPFDKIRCGEWPGAGNSCSDCGVTFR